jgi:predicted transcriptional regulator
MHQHTSPDGPGQDRHEGVCQPLPLGWPLERALLIVLLRSSRQLSSRELAQETGENSVDLEHAIDALVGAGLARRERGLVLPTRAAVRFDELGI